MPKLRDILTDSELNQIETLKYAMELSQTKEDVDVFYNQIIDILNEAKKRHFGKLRKPSYEEKKHLA